MTKKKILAIFLGIIMAGLIGLLLYSNLFAKDEEDSSPSSNKEENLVIKEHIFEDLTINNMDIKKDNNNYSIKFDFKSNTSYEYLFLSIRFVDKDEKVLFHAPIYLEDVVAGEDRVVEYSWKDIDITSTYDYSFVKSEPEGIG